MKTTTYNGNNVVGDTIRREEQLQWLGGFFCGEGCITMWVDKRDNRKRICSQAGVVNTDKILIEKVEKILRVNGIAPVIYWTKSGRNKPLGVIKITGNGKLNKFLTMLLPYLFGTKSEVAKVLLKYIDYRNSIPHSYGNIHTIKVKRVSVIDDPVIINFIEKVRLLNSSPQRLHALHPKKG